MKTFFQSKIMAFAVLRLLTILPLSLKSSRNFSRIPNRFEPKLNLPYFYNTSQKLHNVNVYDNLVKQKMSSGDDKKHKFPKDIESALNQQIQIELTASFGYLSMACYYGRTEVALPGCQGFFMNMHEEEHEHSIILLNYVLMRGGHVCVPTVGPPEHQDWKNISKTFSTAVQMECTVKEKLEALVELCEKYRDLQLADFISGEFLEEQNKSIQLLARLLTRSKMACNDIGEYLFDQHIYESFVKPKKNNLMYTDHLPQDEHGQKVYK